MNQQEWQSIIQRLLTSDAGFAAGMLVAQFMQEISRFSEEVKALRDEVAQWRNILTELASIAEQGSQWKETMQQIQQTLLAVQQALAQQLLTSWQQSPIAETLSRWASFTLGYSQIVMQIVADAEGATDKVQFTRENEVRLESLIRPFNLPETDSSEAVVFKPLFEAECERVRKNALQRLAEIGIVLKEPSIGANFDPKWQEIVGGEFTDDPTKNDTIAKVQTSAIFVDNEPIVRARVIVWKIEKV